MIETMQQEIQLRSDYMKEPELKSIYFGGGTPSLLNDEELNLLFETIRANFTLSANCEITLEANPDDISEQSLSNWRNAGVNRLSIGLQSFKEADLEWMNRAHSVKEALNCVSLAQKAGFCTISVDLIYGLPELSLEDWEKHIDTVLNMGVQHISAYCLTVEKKTALHHLVESNKIVPANEDVQSEQFLLLSKKLKTFGFQHYEISNFALPGKEAIHNSSYWSGSEYLGIGPSAHSFNGISRRWNVSNNSLYIKNFSLKESWFEEEILSPKDRWNELIMTGLRTSRGVELENLAYISAITEGFLNQLNKFASSGWLILKDNKIILTQEGRLKADFIASELFL
jgi:oxygen-independent coproporphyrinogen-3 oxidase